MDDLLQKGPEITYYQDGSNLVTNTRAVLNSQTYAMADIISVSMGEAPANRTIRTIVAAIIALIGVGLGGYAIVLGGGSPTMDEMRICWVLSIMGTIFIFTGLSIYNANPTPITALIGVGLWGYACIMVGGWGYDNIIVPLLNLSPTIMGYLAMGYIIFAMNITGAGAILILIGVSNFANKLEKPKYVVNIGNASGESNALVSVDKALIQKIVDAISQVIHSEEITYYQDKNTLVTNMRAILNSKTYAMAHINSASLGEVPPNRILGIIMALFGLGSLISRLSMIFKAHYSNRIVFYGAFFDLNIIIMMVIVGIGIFLAIFAKPKYAVKIGSASGESKAFISADQALVQKIVDSIHQAIIKRG